VAPVVHLGATPVFVDIEPKYWCVDPTEVRKAITPRTRAIIATHLYGNVANLTELCKISGEFGIPLIEDSAEAIGAKYRDQPTGSIGAFGVFSFHGTKTITTGEGGIFVTSDEELFERVTTLSNHGRARMQTKQFWPDMVGYKFKMSNLQAALGCAQLARANELVLRKKEIMDLYKSLLGGYEQLQLNEQAPDCVNGWWMPTVVWSESLCVDREYVRARFGDREVDARVFFPPLSSLPMFNQDQAFWASNISNRALNLPSFHDISEDQIEEICGNLTLALGLARK
jgi:perosamine synthetase